MKFWLYDNELSKAQGTCGIEAGNPAQAAKHFAEEGFLGIYLIVDENDHFTKWDLRKTVVHYAYPVP